jgi:hypothetical protein
MNDFVDFVDSLELESHKALALVFSNAWANPFHVNILFK